MRKATGLQSRRFGANSPLRLSEQAMSQVTFDRVLALNRELAALAGAGVPLELGARSSAAETLLEKANASLALRTSLGQPLDKALEDNAELPGIYRSAIESGIRSGNFTAVLDGVTRQSLAEEELQHTFSRSFLQPLILVVLAYFGLILLCLQFSPTLEGIYTQLRQEPNIGIVLLRSAREWLPVWGPLVPLALIVALLVWRRGAKFPHTFIPWGGRYEATVARANLAEQLATLLDNGAPLPEAIVLAAGVTGDRQMISAAQALADAHQHGEKLAADDNRLRDVPPLLRWALTGDSGGQPLPDILRFIAETYKQSAERRSAVWQIVLPTLIGALVGGAIVFAFALSMFGPLIQLLRDLAA